MPPYRLTPRARQIGLLSAWIEGRSALARRALGPAPMPPSPPGWLPARAVPTGAGGGLLLPVAGAAVSTSQAGVAGPAQRRFLPVVQRGQSSASATPMASPGATSGSTMPQLSTEPTNVSPVGSPSLAGSVAV